jgi:hypothetical protein
MGLWRTETTAGIEALRARESEVLEVAGSEGIDLDEKRRLGFAEIGGRLGRFLDEEDPDAAGTREEHVDRVVVTEPLKRWHESLVLALVYRDAHHRQMGERYQGKLRLYEEQQADSERELFDDGVGVVRQPLPAPEAPTARAIPGGESRSPVVIAITWVGEGGRESERSSAVLFPGGANAVCQVEASEAPPAGASGWNVYAGEAESELFLQNAVPLAMNVSWELPASVVSTGKRPGEGQRPDYYVRRQRRLRRG